MQLIYEIFPLFLFFLAFKFYGIYVATVVGIVATLSQVLINRFWRGRWDRKQVITFAVFVIFGGMTLYFHNPIFVKWKPTVVFWFFALFILMSHFFAKKPLMQQLTEQMLQEKGVVPAQIWKKLNMVWIVFFIFLGALNLYIAYFFSSDTWVNFKFYGITGALLILSFLQALYLMRFMTEDKTKK